MINTSSNKLKKLFFLSVLSVLLFYLIFRNFPKLNQKQIILTTPNIYINGPENLESYKYSVNDFEIIFTKLTLYKFEAIPNFKNQFTSQDIIDSKKCKVLFNGGFYMKNTYPLGLYYYNQNKIGNIIKSYIINGIITLDMDNQWNIMPSTDYSFDKSSIFVIQSGPILVSKSKIIDPLNINILGRRVLFVLDKSNNPGVLVAYNKNDINDGPDFNDLLDIIKILIKENGLDIYNAINLDGGNSSLYIDRFTFFKESTFPGSYFCFH